MSDTPATDAFFFRTDIEWDDEVEFARKLERERNAARDRAWKLARERNHWKSECLEQAKLLAMSADREEKLLQQIASLKSQVSNLQFS